MRVTPTPERASQPSRSREPEPRPDSHDPHSLIAGYVGNGLQHKPPAVIAYEQTDDAGETKGDLVFGTRSTTSGAGAATQQVRLRSNGTVEVETNLQVDSTAVFNDEATFERAVTIKGTFTASGGYDMSADITMTKTAAGITHVAAPAVDNGLTINSTNGYVGVEDVKFTGVQIGIEGDEDIITLTSAASVGNVAVAGGISASDDVTLSKQSAALTHSGSTGGGLSITSTNGYVEISSTASYVDVESVRVTGAQMGVSGDTDIITLSSASGVGNVAIAGELNVSLDVDVGSSAFVVTASDGSLAISSNKFTVAGDTGNTVVAGTLNATGAAALSSTLDVAGDVDVNSGKFAVTASDGSLAISSNKFTVAGDTGNTVVAGTLNATGAATLSSTLDVAGDVDVNSGKFAVTASDGSLAISSNKFTVAGDTGNTVVAGTLNATGAATLSSTLDVAGDVDVNSGKFAVDGIGRVAGDFVEQVHGGWRHGQHGGGGDAERDGSCDAVEHAGCGRRRGREQWEVCGDGIGRVAGDFVEQVHGGWRHGQHGGGGDAERDGSCDAVEHAGCGRRRGREQWEVCGDGIGRVAGDFVEQVHGGWRHGQHCRIWASCSRRPHR